MTARRTYESRASISRSSYRKGKCRRYWVEAWGAEEKPNGLVEPACITLCNREGGPPMHHIFCDQMKRINPTSTNCTILIDLLDGHTVEVKVEDEVLWRRWTKHIGLLLTIPFYPIPLEPSVGLPAEFLLDISPQAYDSRGTASWGVAIQQAGISDKAGLKNNAFCVIVVTSDDQLKIYPWNVTTAPIITWDRDKLRQSGSIGNMVFLEAGRRCRFGPGLLWMFAESSVSVSLREGLLTFLFRGGNKMAGHFRRASEVSMASSRSAGHVLHRQPQGTSSVNSMASDSWIGTERLNSRGIHSHPSVCHKHRSPPVKQHSHLSSSSVDDQLEFDSERDSPTSGRSQTRLIRRQQSQNGYYNTGGSPPFDMDDEDGLRRHTIAPERNCSFRYSPPEMSFFDMSDYETMAPSKSLSTPPKNGLTTLPYHTEDARYYPQNQDSLINDMMAMNVFDQAAPNNPRSNYDNIRLQPLQENYENTSIRFKPVSSD